MLRSRYWSGLYSDQIKNALRHHFDDGADFEVLLRQARMAEQEPDRMSAQQSQSLQNQDKLDIIMQQLSEMNSKMQEMETKLVEFEESLTRQTKDSETCPPVPSLKSSVGSQTSTVTKSPTQFPGKCYACGQVGHKQGSSERPKTVVRNCSRSVKEDRLLVDVHGPSSAGEDAKGPDRQVKVSSAKVDNVSSSDDHDDERQQQSSSKLSGENVVGLVGPSCEVLVALEGTSCQALLETGSMVSTVTYSLSQ